MSVTCAYEQDGARGVLLVSGRIDSATAPEFQAGTFDALDTEPAGGLVVDFTDVAYISSAGLRVLLMAAKRQKKAGRPFAVCGLSENARKVFEMGGFHKIVPLFDTRADAP